MSASTGERPNARVGSLPFTTEKERNLRREHRRLHPDGMLRSGRVCDVCLLLAQLNLERQRRESPTCGCGHGPMRHHFGGTSAAYCTEPWCKCWGWRPEPAHPEGCASPALGVGGGKDEPA